MRVERAQSALLTGLQAEILRPDTVEYIAGQLTVAVAEADSSVAGQIKALDR